MEKQMIVTTSKLTKSYGQVTALKEFDLQIRKGEILGIAGPNGAGKTTLFRILTGLAPAFEGEMSLFYSTEAKKIRENRKYLGAIIENPAFYANMSARENLEYLRLQRGVADKKRIDELLEIVDLKESEKQKFKDFSLGMKQRLAIASALLHRPELLILDEPTNGLDPAGIIEIRNLLKKLSRENGLSILISSHILSELENLADRFIIINRGQKVDEFTKDELQTRLQNYYEITTKQTEQAVTLLETKFHLSHYEINEDKHIQLFDLSVPISEINRVFVENGIEVTGLTHRKYHLEDLYMELTEGGAVDAKFIN